MPRQNNTILGNHTRKAGINPVNIHFYFISRPRTFSSGSDSMPVTSMYGQGEKQSSAHYCERHVECRDTRVHAYHKSAVSIKRLLALVKTPENLHRAASSTQQLTAAHSSLQQLTTVSHCSSSNTQLTHQLTAYPGG